MRELIESRLNALKSEYNIGQAQLRELDGQLTTLRETMLRISGAITVLQELLNAPALATPSPQKPRPEDSDPQASAA
jgi:hypothetical protein